jgi:hypothetical protein
MESASGTFIRRRTSRGNPPRNFAKAPSSEIPSSRCVGTRDKLDSRQKLCNAMCPLEERMFGKENVTIELLLAAAILAAPAATMAQTTPAGTNTDQVKKEN